MHLAVEMKDDSITMLYRIGEGFVKEENYGIALARVVGMPPKVLKIAGTVSKALEEQMAAKKRSSKSVAVAKRRKLVLNLKETLEALDKGPMADRPLYNFLKKLQEEFVTRMEAIEAEVKNNEVEICEEGSQNLQSSSEF